MFEDAKKRKCSVPECKDLFTKRHRFPKSDLILFNTWLKNVNNPKLFELTQEVVYKSHYVCDRHFLPKYLLPGSKYGLTPIAIPTLHLSGTEEKIEEVQSKELDTAQEEPSTLTETKDTFEEFTNIELGDIYVAEGIPSTSSARDNLMKDRDNQPKEICITLEKPGTSTQGPEFPSGSKGTVGIKKRKLILQEVDVTRQKDLTPRCKKLYKKMIEWSNKTAKLNSKIASFESRFRRAEKIASSPKFQNLLKYVNEVTYHFIIQQIRTQSLPPKARRYSMNDKLLALCLLKASGKGYKMLSKIFTLPSRRTLTNLLNKLPLYPGINEQIFETLKNGVDKMKELEKYCFILFDELSIDSTLFYNKKEDCIEGLEDAGDKRGIKLADYANVFMVKGIYRQWKQPIAFLFTCGPTKSVILKEFLKNLISRCQRIGLKIVATVCDQGSANQAALNYLINESHKQQENEISFKVNENEIIPIFDVPHLFKGLRNNLLNKNLHFTINGEEKIAKWDDIVDFYYLDTADNTRICPKLTDVHILPNKINKMKVSCCTQVFSNQVGSLMKRISQWDIQDKYKLKKSASDTADLILFLDRLFDSLNSNTKVAPSSKALKGGVTKHSGHKKFWYDSLKIINSMKFFSAEKKRYVSTPSLKNLSKTIRGFIYLSEKLLASGFSYILPRAINQDPLENFFASIRSHGVRNVTPNVTQFISSYKALLLNNFLSSHSPNANCEEDFSGSAIDSLHCFLTGEVIPGVRPLEADDDFKIPGHISLQKRTRVGNATLNYIAGYVAKKSLKETNNCEFCKQLLLHSQGAEQNMEFIEARQYRSSTLLKPGQFLVFLLQQALSKLFYILPRTCNKLKIHKVLARLLLKETSFAPIKCNNHLNLDSIVCKHIINCVVYFWVKRVNLILKGKDSKFNSFIRTHPNHNFADPVMLMAYKKFLSRRKTSQ